MPRLIYGTWKEVKPRIGKVITRLRRGASWAEAMQADKLLDTKTSPGLIILDGPAGSGGPHFHCFGPMRLVRAAIHDERLPKTAEEALSLKTEELAAGLVALPPMKIHCAQLVEGALRSALRPQAAADGAAVDPAKPSAVPAPTLLDSFSKPKAAGVKITFLEPSPPK